MASTLARTGLQSFGEQTLDVETRIKNLIYKKSIRIRDFFQDFDRLRKGIVTVDKFRTALVYLNIYLSQEDVTYLVEKYRVSVDQVNYERFCNEINQVFEQDAQHQIKIQVLDKQDPSVQKVLDAFRNVVKTKRINLKAQFMDFDRTKNCTVTIDQFCRVLQAIGILPPADAFSKLVQVYSENGKEINYVHFCQDTDDTKEYLAMTSQDLYKPQPTSYKPTQDNSDLNLVNNLFINTRQSNNFTSSDVLKKVQAQVVIKQLRIKEFFKDFDNLRKGTVTQSQFNRIIVQTGVKLTNDELNLLISQYKNNQDLVKYHEFCEHVDLVFTEKDIDKDPLRKINQINQSTTLPARRQLLQFTEQEYSELQNLLQSYQKTITSRRVLLKPLFQDFDLTKQGYCSKNQFLRVLNQFNLFPNAQSLNLLLKKYIDNGNNQEVNYFDFCKDVDSFTEGVEVSKNHAKAFENYVQTSKKDFDTIVTAVPNDINDLIAKLQKKVKEQRIRVFEFLRDFDKLRSGSITSNQFRLGLNLAKIQLSNDEFNLLVNHFACDKKLGFVQWKTFSDQIEEVFLIKSLEQYDPMMDVPAPNLDFNYGKELVTEEDQLIIANISQRFTRFCVQNRIDTKSFFKDWDALNRSKVTFKQFKQVLSTIKFYLSDREYESIKKMYTCNEDDSILYQVFINDNYRPSETMDQQIAKMLLNENVSQSSTYKAVSNKTNFVTLETVLNKFKSEIKIKNIRIEEYFRDYDPLRKGSIPANKFRGIITQMKIVLNDNEQQLLENVYRSADPLKIDYQRFLNDILTVFTVSELEKDPLKVPQQFTPLRQQDNELTTFEQECLDDLLQKLASAIQKRRISFKTHFQDKDVSRSGKVSYTRLRSILDIHKLPLTEQQFKVLCKRFSFEGAEFNYVEFDLALKQYESRA